VLNEAIELTILCQLHDIVTQRGLALESQILLHVLALADLPILVLLQLNFFVCHMVRVIKIVVIIALIGPLRSVAAMRLFLGLRDLSCFNLVWSCHGKLPPSLDELLLHDCAIEGGVQDFHNVGVTALC
jgi:hypothetical protein